jgi:hypothetical protein
MATAPLGQPHESLRSIVLVRIARGLKGTVAATEDCRRPMGAEELNQRCLALPRHGNYQITKTNLGAASLHCYLLFKVSFYLLFRSHENARRRAPNAKR